MAPTGTANPLTRLLLAINRSGVHSCGQLAQELDISSSFVQQLLAALVAQGYLQPVNNGADCPTLCDGCALKPGCLHADSSLWQVSEKGRRAIRQLTADE